MNYFLRKESKFNVEISIINITFLIYIFRTAIPSFKYPFIILYTGLLIHCAINHRKQLFSASKDFFSAFKLIFVLFLLLGVAVIFSNKLYLMIFKDGINILVLISLFYILNLFITTKNEVKLLVSNLLYFIIFFALLISLFELLDLFDILSNSKIVLKSNILKDSLLIDNNFALLPIFFGMIGIFYLLRADIKISKKITYNFSLLVFTLAIFFSGSRRGFLLYIAIVLFLIVLKITGFVRKDKFLKEAASNFNVYLISLFTLAVFFYLFVFHTTVSFKTNIIKFSGAKNDIMAKFKISKNIFRYYSAFDNDISFPEFYNVIWSQNYNHAEVRGIMITDSDPKDPDSGWGTRIHKTIFPLSGKNSEIVPEGSKGYMMDRTCDPSYSSGNDMCDSYSLIAFLKVNKGDRYKASICCFVSETFDGDAVRFLVATDCIDKRIVYGNPSASYDLASKGIWKKLEIDFICNDGEVPIYISFYKYGVKDFSALKGSVIFAYPQLTKIKNQDPDLSVCDRDMTRSDFKNQPNLLQSKIYPFSPVTPNSSKFLLSGLFCYPSLVFSTAGYIQKDYDPFRNWVSKFISEDTTYYPYRSNIAVDTMSNIFIGDRILRWKFALNIFSREYDWKQKCFGGGFNFLNWYGYYFYRDTTRSDYPHNPFLSVLLYSGIFGLIIYLIFMYKVFYYYIKYFNEYKILTLFFVITFFFSFFSAGNPFDPPMMGFLVLLPFFIHFIHQKSKAVLT